MIAAGDAESVKPGVDLTVRLIAVVLCRLPDVPVIVTLEVPGTAVLLAVSVRVLLPAVLAGLKDPVTPPGSPEAVKATAPLKPFCGVTVMTLVPGLPCVSATLDGAAESV